MSKRVVRKRATGRALRRKRVRKKISGTAQRPRLTVFRGNRSMSCQVIDDERGITIAAASTNEKEFSQAAKTPKIEAAKMLGAAIATRAQEKGVTKVVFDRSGYKYHGRVKAMADAAREKGLIF